MAVGVQIAAWTSLWAFWVVISRNNHPTLLLNCTATALMLASFAVAVYFNWLLLVPRFWNRRQFASHWLYLGATLCTLTALVVMLIQAVYDVLWGPDPRRFGFWVNYGLDFTGTSVHLALAAMVVWLLRRRRPTA